VCLAVFGFSQTAIVESWAQTQESTPATAAPLSPDAFKQLFAPLEKAKSKVWQDGKGAAVRFSGLWKLQAPWPDDAALRLQVAPGSRLRVHLWRDQQGVSLLFGDHYKAPHRWIAYAVTREKDTLRPSAYAMAADDDGRYGRVQPPVQSGQAPTILPTDIRYRDGNIIVSCAGVRLLTVPLSGKPDTVCVEEAEPAAGPSAPALLAAEMVQAGASPDDRPLALKTVLDQQHPASLQWKTSSGAELRKLPDGRLWLNAPTNEKVSWGAVTIPKGGIREFVFEIENAQPGSGVYVGDSEGAALAGLHVLASQGATMVRVAEPSQPVTPYRHDTNASAEPMVGNIVRLRALVACGRMKVWVGTQDAGWAALWPDAAVAKGEKSIATVGFYCLASNRGRNERPHGIILRRIQVREYAAINSLTAENLILRAPDLHTSPPGEWLAKASAAQPNNVALGAWLRACAVRSVADGAPYRLGGALLDALAADTIGGASPYQDRIEAIHQLATVSPSAPADGNVPAEYAARWARLEDVYDRAGRAAIEQDGGEAFVQLGVRVFGLTPPPGGTVESLWQRLARREIVRCVLAEQWEKLDELGERLGIYHRRDLDGVMRWGRMQSPQHLQDGRSDGAPRHAWGLTDSRAEWSFKTDFRNAVDNEQFDLACRLLIARYAETANLGLVRDPIAPCGWISLEASAGALMRKYPQVQQTLIEKYSLRGKLRVRQAIADKDAVRVTCAAAQFYGTPAAGEAHVWLGDRAYLAGLFGQAVEHYAIAATSADVITRGKVMIRHRLAAAKLGRKIGQPATEAITIGEGTWPPEKIEQEVAGALQAAASGAHDASEGRLPWALPQPAKFSAMIVNDAGQMPPRPAGVPAAFWTPQGIERLMSVVPHATPFFGDFYCERAGNDLRCTNLKGGNWQTQIPGIPTVLGRDYRGRRQQVQAPFEQWPRRLFMASQPAAVGSRVYALFEEQTNELGAGRISLHGFELADGKRVSDAPLFSLRQFSGGQQNILFKIVGGRCLVWHERGILCGRIGGAVSWARLPQPVALRPGGAAEVPGGSVDRLLVDGERVYLADAGVPYAECLDLARGTRQWVSLPLEVRRVVGRVGDRVVVETADELVALDAAGGGVVWRRVADHLPDALAADEAGGVLYARLTRTGDKAAPNRVELVWVDPKNGQTRATVLLANLFESNVPTMRFGPFIGLGRELIALAQSGQPGSKVQVVRLTPAGAAPAANPDDEERRLWQSCLLTAGS
jgi:hypothetical protein